MKITWIGHSCFKVQTGDYCVILDPYEDASVPGLAPVREAANEVLCSHEHGDHNARALVTLQQAEKRGIAVTRIHTYHDEEKGAKRGENVIHILDDGNVRIAHFGDLGCCLEEDQLKMLQNLDAALIPVGGFYTIDAGQAAELAEQIHPGIVIPMHYRDDEKGFGFPVIGTVEQFTALMTEVEAAGNSEIEIEAGSKDKMKTVLLVPRNAQQ